MPPHFFQAKNLAVKFDGLFEIVDSIARMQKFCRLAHNQRIPPNRFNATMGSNTACSPVWFWIGKRPCLH